MQYWYLLVYVFKHNFSVRTYVLLPTLGKDRWRADLKFDNFLPNLDILGFH